MNGEQMKKLQSIIDKIKSFKRQDNAKRGLFPASATDRWLECPKSVLLSQGIPRVDTVYSTEGRLAHAVCEAVYNYQYHGVPYSTELNRELGGQEDFGEAMEDHAKNYVARIMDTIVKGTLGDILYMDVEKYLYADDVRDETRFGGIADFIAIGTRGAIIIDYKYGVGHRVGPHTPQLLTYLTALRDIKIDGYKFIAGIYQPRVEDKLRLHTYERDGLVVHYAKMAESRKLKDTADLKTGSHCHWCPAKRTNDMDKRCKAIDKKQTTELTGTMFKAMGIIEESRKERPKDSILKEFFELLPIIDRYRKVFEEELKERLGAGEKIEGFALTSRPGRRKWAGSVDDLRDRLVSAFPKLAVRGVVRESLKTITDIEKVIGKGKLDGFTEVGDDKEILKVVDEVNINEDEINTIMNSLKD